MKTGGVVAVSASVAFLAVFLVGGGGDSGAGGSTVTLQPQQAAAPAVPGQVAGQVASCVAAPSVEQLGLKPEQVDVARRGIAAANRAGTGVRGAEIIIATGLVESELQNLSYGDRDSIGWLQQRPSQGWGNAGDVDKGADDFFRSMFELVPDWQSADKGAVAQRVQRSAFPTRYGERMGEAERIVATLTGDGACAATAKPVTASGPVSPAASAAVAWGLTKSGGPYVFGGNGPRGFDCSSFTRTAYAQSGINMPRTAEAQRRWCKSGNCTPVQLGQEQPGDLIFWDSYLGPGQAGHVVMVNDPAQRSTIEARSTKLGIGVFNYKSQSAPGAKTIFEIYRVN